ncbi:SymE family type I addiction module toxin [Klebsiella oxytoca]|uniref:SymE family type I addiction module toxin n=1 Tax=Klebsiella oxytoca TaxID=571 RepID=UPI00115BCA34|nr:SymE family type I addiction module toxin [Klebsiella oxytoca]
MADSHSTSDFAVSGTERHLIVGYRPQGRDTSTSSLTLSGKWLRAAGFDTGKRFTVKVMDGCIVLLPQSDKEEMLKAELLQIQQSFKSVNNTLHLV